MIAEKGRMRGKNDVREDETNYCGAVERRGI